MPVRKATFGLTVALAGSILYLVLHYVTNSIFSVVAKPYMDEIFHVPQAQKICNGNLTYYDPKLTTPPGLYIVSYIRIWLRDRILRQRMNLTCDTIDLRRTNHLIAISNLFTVVLIQLTAANSKINLSRKYGFRQRITYTLDQSTTSDLAKILLTSIAIITLPPLFFFNSLYYTDAGSLLFTLVAYLFSINEHHLLSSLSGLIAISFRQTNIVWIFYIACIVIIKTFEESKYSVSRASDHGSSAPKSDKSHANVSSNPPSLRGPNRNCYLSLIVENRALILNLVKKCTPYALVGFVFVTFVIINKGIVIGDKEAHQPKLHLAQMLYFLGFCSIFGSSWIFHIRLLRRFLYFIIRSPVTAALASALIIYLISFGRYAHPYLLADNRHLTFYIWRRILDRHNSYVPYLLTPIYLLSSLSIWHHFRSKGCKRTLLYIFCTIAVTIPNGLLEPRYFIIPYIILRLNIDTGFVGLILEICQHFIINVSMHYLFVHKTFRWSDSPEVQRIMW